MASKAVEDAVDAYLASNWTRCPILKENEQGEAPTDGSPFLILQFPVSDVRRSDVGRKRYREEGGFRIVINVERGFGTATMRQWGEELAVLFRDVAIGPVHCRVPTEPFTDDQSDQGNYFQGSLICPYTYNIDG